MWKNIFVEKKYFSYSWNSPSRRQKWIIDFSNINTNTHAIRNEWSWAASANVHFFHEKKWSNIAFSNRPANRQSECFTVIGNNKFNYPTPRSYAGSCSKGQARCICGVKKASYQTITLRESMKIITHIVEIISSFAYQIHDITQNLSLDRR